MRLATDSMPIMGRLDARRVLNLTKIRGARGGARAGGGGFTGTAYSPAGVKTTALTSDSGKGWIRYSLTDDAFTEQTGPPPSPWGADEVWYEKAHTYGDIVVTRFG